MSIKFCTNKTLVLSVFFSFATLSSAQSFALDGKALYTSKGCAACHGADAKSPIMPTYPKIAGQSIEYASQQLKDIKSGARSNGQSAAMKGVMSAVSDEEISAIAEYISKL